MGIHIIDEANRCLNCKKPKCMEGCPVHTPIPHIIQMFKEHRVMEAGQELFQNNPMSLICSIVCNHEMQCAGSCVLGKKANPVHFSSIETYISDTYLDRMKVTAPAQQKEKVAVIGAGPAGMTVAVILAQEGYGVTIFEQQNKIGGIMQYGIPEFRLPKTILDRYKKKILEMGIRIRPNTAIGTTLTIEDLLRDGYAREWEMRQWMWPEQRFETERIRLLCMPEAGMWQQAHMRWRMQSWTVQNLYLERQ